MKIGRGSIGTTSIRHGAPLGRSYFAAKPTGWSNPNAQRNLARNMAIIRNQQAQSARTAAFVRNWRR